MSSYQDQKKRVVQFAGHGGSHIGCAHNGIIEKDWALAFCRDAHVALETLGYAASFMGREEDVDMGRATRGAIAREAQAGLVLCHHVNAHEDEEIDGLMTFVLTGDLVGWEVASAIARCAPAGLLRYKPKPYFCNRSDWTGRAYNVLKHHRGVPAVLVEWGFSSSVRDAAILKSMDSRPALLATNLAGVTRFLEVNR